MVERPEAVRYGTPNAELLSRWLALPPEQDGPFWALNLMKYREVADYADGRESTRSGREADDEYTPRGPLAAIGATIAFAGEVAEQLAGEPSWDRVGIVRYPSRASFFAMQQRDDFKAQHVHKDAGMAFTIVMATHPEVVTEPPPSAEGAYVVRVRRFGPGAVPDADPPGVHPVARFGVEGVIVGDDRRWDQVCFDRVDETAIAGLGGTRGVEEQVVVVLDLLVDDLARSVETVPTVG
jgi:hypothetical protein